MSYVQNTDSDRREMLGEIGVSSFEELLEPIAPKLRVGGALDLGDPMSEAEVASRLGELAAKHRYSDNHDRHLAPLDDSASKAVF